ncbi:MAG TPA: hypothetical protein VF495_07075 [Phenylobacterium sp.]
MVSLDDYIDDEEGAADFEALKDALKALADAVASTNLAVIHAAQGDAAGATQRVQASVAALTRFHAAYTALDAAPEGEETEEDGDEDD